MSSDNELLLQTRFEVESAIKSVEEDSEKKLAFTVVGSILAPLEKPAYLVVTKIDNKTIGYGVVTANTPEEASELTLTNKFFSKRNVEIKSIKNITHLIKNYYEES